MNLKWSGLNGGGRAPDSFTRHTHTHIHTRWFEYERFSGSVVCHWLLAVGPWHFFCRYIRCDDNNNNDRSICHPITCNHGWDTHTHTHLYKPLLKHRLMVRVFCVLERGIMRFWEQNSGKKLSCGLHFVSITTLLYTRHSLLPNTAFREIIVHTVLSLYY